MLGSRCGHCTSQSLRRSSVGRERVKPATGANARSEAHTVTSNHERPAHGFAVGLTYRTAVCGTRLYGGVGGEGP